MTGRRHRLRRGAFAVALVLGSAGACAVPVDEEPTELSGSIVPETTTTTSTTSPEVVTRRVLTYYLDSEDGTTELTPVERSVAAGSGLQGVLTSLFTNRPTDDDPGEAGLSSAIPESAELVAAAPSAEDPSRLIVEVRGLFGPEGIQGGELRDALAQIVWTATEDTGITEVVFLQDGSRRDALIDDLEQTAEPVVRADYAREN